MGSSEYRCLGCMSRDADLQGLVHTRVLALCQFTASSHSNSQLLLTITGPDQCFSECGPRTSSGGSGRSSLEKQNLGSYPRPAETEAWDQWCVLSSSPGSFMHENILKSSGLETFLRVPTRFQNL